MCELCETLKTSPKDKIYFETEEIAIIEKNENLVVGMLKAHVKDIEDGKASGLIKVMMKSTSRNKPGSVYTFKKADDCKDHFGIYCTVKTKI